MKKLIMAVFGVVVLFLVILCVNTVRFSTKQDIVKSVQTIDVDRDKVSERLAQALKIPTISHQDKKKFNPTPFFEFHKLLEKNYPLVHQRLQRKIINQYSLLYKWPGSDPHVKPVVFMAHIDVVPVESDTESKWTYGAYSGQIADGYVWGRGAIDMKSTLTSIMEAVEAQLEQGITPKRTIYLAFGHDEEIGGKDGAKKIVSFLKESGIHIDFTIDEGMTIVDKSLSPTKQPIGVIGIGEKGYVTLKITATGRGGHSSMPASPTSVGILAEAILRLEQNPMPASFAGPVKLLFEALGPELPLVQKVLFANRWAFKRIIINQLSEIPSMNAMLRTTTAPTVVRGGMKENVIPTQAYALVNFRILPGDTPKDVIAHARSVIANPAVEVSKHDGHDGTPPSPVASVDSAGYSIIRQTIKEVFDNMITTPGLVLGGTDSKHFTAISDNNYRFFPVIIGMEDTKRIHGIDERIAVDNYVKMIQFHAQLIRNISGPM